MGPAIIPIRTPAGEADVIVIATTGSIPLKAHTGGFIAFLTEHFRQDRNTLNDICLVERHHIGTEAVAARKHIGITRGRGNMGAEALFKSNAVFCVFGNMRGSQTLIAVVTHMVTAQAVNAKEQNVGFLLCHTILLPLPGAQLL